ncbi:hypothetical protein I0C86_41155 [Plantactinospora sp. S1510]|uniref:Uncharacterized protein n=1 Tax=Plantactinospora alkalitolerans TaxID=2789879 RepID=A0ABS0H9V3_9ACTN|nr:hypothetical protein [Plantactinospora alkalitolerans]MBF9135261.1 hypothetical protein [Plantactinospora alkalitolerans]
MAGKQHTIGEGVLASHSGERHTDRYGLAYLKVENRGDSAPVEVNVGEHAGRLGTLYAEVVEPSESDGPRRFGPEAARVGEVVALGTGELFTEAAFRDKDNDVPGVGVKPTDGRECWWMDSMALYRVRHQRVRLFFVPA